MSSNPLKLVALDSEDLEVLSATVQDSVLRVGDLQYLPRENRVLVALNRFAWDAPEEGSGKDSYERHRAVLRFDRVQAVRHQNIKQGAEEAVLNLLAVRFQELDAPGGHIDLFFSGGGALRLDVDCIEVQLTDLGAAWRTKSMPHHDDEQEDGQGA